MREPGVEDATRRTRLANERTYLAWWRTGLTALAVCVGLGKLVPGVTEHVTRWPYELVGAGFGLLGIAFLVARLPAGAARSRTRSTHGTFAELDRRLLARARRGSGSIARDRDDPDRAASRSS